jgi:hypothetical protein
VRRIRAVFRRRTVPVFRHGPIMPCCGPPRKGPGGTIPRLRAKILKYLVNTIR